MIYSKPCEYAIRALVFLARFPDQGAAQGMEIAKAEGLPAPVLGKVLQELVRKGLLESRRGPGGGFRLARNSQLITLRDVVAAIDGLDQFAECSVGLEGCSDDSPCPLHDTWKVLRRQLMNNLEVTTLADMAATVTRKNKLLRHPTQARGK
ncbi:MAG: Rrf2 family transcriptional regulator [Candidatus Acidiferrales bacterium]|jgi:Rrf2 family protein